MLSQPDRKSNLLVALFSTCPGGAPVATCGGVRRASGFVLTCYPEIETRIREPSLSGKLGSRAFMPAESANLRDRGRQLFGMPGILSVIVHSSWLAALRRPTR